MSINISKSPILAFLNDKRSHYLTSSQNISVKAADEYSYKDNDIILFRVDEMTFEEKAPRKEALENVLSAVRIPGINFLYLIMGNKKGVKFYYGLSKDPSSFKENLYMREIATGILKSSLEGNFRGCDIHEITAEEKELILKKMRNTMSKTARLEGVAGTIEDKEEFQSVDRLVNVMRGSEFCLLIVAQAIQSDQLSQIEENLNCAYSKLNTDVKYSKQIGNNTSLSESASISDGNNCSETISKNRTSGKSDSTQNSHSTNVSKGSSDTTNNSSTNSSGGTSTSSSKTHVDSSSYQEGISKGKSISHSESKQKGTSTSNSETFSREYLDKCAQEWIKYCDEVLFPRLDYSRGKGLFQYAFYIMANSENDIIKLENTAISLYSGKKGNRVPLKSFRIDDTSPVFQMAKYCQIPKCTFKRNISDSEKMARSLLSQDIRNGEFTMGNWISTNELSLIAGLPQKEVVGMRLRELVEFGLNQDTENNDDKIKIGSIIQDGKENTNYPVYLNKNVLDKHIFIAGATGSGKTTTCQSILLKTNLPFLVIEPAKTEYRILKNEKTCSDLIVFTPGNEEAAPFRINPFEFMPMESITSHVDMIKASMEAAFDMEAAIPQIIEAGIYRCYENYGWDIMTNSNSKYDHPFSAGTPAFPTISDLLRCIPDIVREQGFDERLYDEYVGSIRARLQSLTLGAKGLMLDTPRSINFNALLDKKVVLELDNIRNGDEKALIMGFVLSSFNEAVRERYLFDDERHNHILLVEEAHRLLSRYSPGDSKNKKLGVAIFTDMLAEIRKYGESLVIVDQIPNKLAPEVLKNTNTKIIHRLFAQDDKEAVGNTMALEDDQKRYLSNLDIGQAVMFSDHFGQAILVKIDELVKTSRKPPKDCELTSPAFDYYLKYCSLCPLNKDFSNIPNKYHSIFLQYFLENIPLLIIKNWYKNRTVDDSLQAKLRLMSENDFISIKETAEWISIYLHKENYQKYISLYEDFLNAYLKGNEYARRAYMP